ncbi:hypothetical protein [Streptomyces antibioticus]|uniref:hypothetical protein n=1 Tax=Streptomyces antibioticus TaxID=1890 RepID=UPI003F4C2F1A
MPGTVLLLAASPAGKGCLVDAASVLPVLAAVPPAILAGTDTANVVELADPLEPQAVLTRLRAAAAAPGPLTLFITGQLQLDRRQHLPHLALARTTASTVRYTALPWHWLREELRLRTPGTTTLLVDLHADAETWGWLRGHVLECGPGVSVYGRIAPPPARRTVAAPTYMKALATILRSGGRPPLDHLHQTALTRIAAEGEVGDLLLHGGTGAGGFAVPVTPAPVPSRPTFTGVRTTAGEPTGGSVNGPPAAGGPAPGTPADGLAAAGASVAGAGAPATDVPPTAHAAATGVGGAGTPSTASVTTPTVSAPGGVAPAAGAPAAGGPTAGAPAGVAPAAGTPAGVAPAASAPAGVAPAAGVPASIASTAGVPAGVVPPAGSSMAAPSEPWPLVPARPAAPAGASAPGQPAAPARRSAEARPVASAGSSVPAQPVVPAAASRPGQAAVPAGAPEASVPGQSPAPARRSAEARPVASAGSSVPAQPVVSAGVSLPVQAPVSAGAPEASVPGQPAAPARRSAEVRAVASAGSCVPAQPVVSAGVSLPVQAAAPASASRPGRATAPTEPPAPARAPGPTLAGLGQDPLDPHTAIALAVRDGRHTDADALAARCEAAAFAAYGGGSEAVLHWSEVRADLAMFAGDAVRSCRAWLAVAAARLDAGQAVDAAAVEAAVDRAHHQWGRVTDPVRARELGPALAELRGRVPGRRRGALDHVRRQLRELQIQG